MIYNVIAIVLSLAAIASSTLTAIRQADLMKRSNHLPAYLSLLNEFRSVVFNDHYHYICEKLNAEHDARAGIRGLPDEVRRAVYDIGYFYQNFVALRQLDIVDDQVITAMNFRIIHVWQAIAPYVIRERELMAARGMQLMEILESYATAAQERPSGSVGRLLGR